MDPKIWDVQLYGGERKRRAWEGKTLCDWIDDLGNTEIIGFDVGFTA